MPLYAPGITHLSFTFARVLGGAHGGTGDHWWDFSADAETTMAGICDLAERDAMPWLDRLRTPADLAARAAEISDTPTSTHVRQAVALSQILIGAYDSARVELRQLHDRIAEGNDRREWLLEMRRLAATMIDELDQDPALTLRRLQDWRSEALIALRLAQHAEGRTAA